MFKKALLLSTLLLATGCVERGYQLTINDTTQTVTAVKSIDIRKEKSDTTQKNIDKMNKAVAKVQKQQSKKNTQLKKDLDNKQHLEEQRLADEKKVLKEKKLKEEKELHEAEQKAAEVKMKENEEKRAALAIKLEKEKEEKRLNAEKERVLLAEKSEAQRIIEAKREKDIQALKEKREREAATKKLEKEEALRKQKEKKELLALEHKLQKEKEAQLAKEKREKAALEEKILLEKKNKELANKKREKELAQKLKLEKEEQEQKVHENKKSPLKTAESLIFKPSKQTYQKFGTSEIHGHVVYMTPSGQEISLKNTKIYLVPQNTKTNYWYNNYYLKNKEASTLSKTIVNYMNATHLNLEKNFAFYGLATGVYYIIIESSYPAHIAKDKKVYIAKKINVDKYKKIMTVFSKKL